MNFQGRLAKPDSTPVADGTYSVRFSLWTAATGGTGLGLAIVKSIAELHGGSAEIASEVGKGTRVRLTLPAEMTKMSSSLHAPVS